MAATFESLRKKGITICGDGSQARSFQYIDGLIEAIVSMMATPVDCTGPLNVGNPVEYSMSGLTEIVLRLTTSKSKRVRRALPQDDPELRCSDMAMGRQVLDGRHLKVSLEEGLEKTVHCFRSVV